MERGLGLCDLAKPTVPDRQPVGAPDRSTKVPGGMWQFRGWCYSDSGHLFPKRHLSGRILGIDLELTIYEGADTSNMTKLCPFSPRFQFGNNQVNLRLLVLAEFL